MQSSVRFIITVTCFVFSGIVQAQTYRADWSSINSRPVPTWFEDAKFGIFIHWGVYSVPSWAPTDAGVYDKYAEWYWKRWEDKSSKVNTLFRAFQEEQYGKGFRYQDFAPMFTAKMFQPQDWAGLFKRAGAKYVVLTSKHHEGFALWPSKQSWNWNAVDVGAHRDLLGDLTAAVKKQGIRMGFYYSLYEWFNPLYHANIDKYVDEHMLPQMKDLVTTYKPDVLWTDGEWDHSSDTWKSTQFLSWLYNESAVKKDVVVNDRWGKETRGKHGGYYTTEYGLVHNEDVTGEAITHPWEECRGIGGSFGYNRNENLEHYSSSHQLIHLLINKVARGGNLLLNIGPTADGLIPVIMQQRLTDMGAWLSVNGDAIYGTRAWKNAPAYNKETNVFYTTKGTDLYVITTSWPETSLAVPGIASFSSVELLGYKGKVKARTKAGRLLLSIPSIHPGQINVEYAWVFRVKDALK